MFTIINYEGKLDFLAWAFGRDERLAGEPFYLPFKNRTTYVVIKVLQLG
jgi:hypothetical protein